MSNQNTAAFKWSNIKSLFGPPPVFSTESEPTYDEIMIQIMESLQPRDFIEIILIKQAGDATWDGIRYLRHKSLGVEQRYLRSLELKARQLKDAQENKEVREVVAKVAQSADELERVADLEIAEDSMRHQIIKVLATSKVI